MFTNTSIEEEAMKKDAEAVRWFGGEEVLEQLDVDTERFRQQVRFLIEADKLKKVMRQTYLTDTSRRENSAEHSWHIALSAMIFAEYARDRGLDLGRVIRMLLVHDLIEIDAGDTYCYDPAAKEDKSQRERTAADRIFNLLPADQAAEWRALWEEFEARRTPESRFANALDRFQPFLHNYVTAGKSWQEHRIRKEQVFGRMQPVHQGSELLWDYVVRLMDDAVARNYLNS